VERRRELAQHGRPIIATPYSSEFDPPAASSLKLPVYDACRRQGLGVRWDQRYPPASRDEANNRLYQPHIFLYGARLEAGISADSKDLGV
jgi:hypothetical protein